MDDQARLLETIRMTAATIKHEINNPLAIVSGNAQLLLELADSSEVDPDMLRSIQDIDEAARRIAASLDKLTVLRDLVLAEYGRSGDGLLSLSPDPLAAGIKESVH